MLSSVKRCGRCISGAGCGKLYLGVVVIVYCSITSIHQYSISLLVKYLSIVHVHLAQYNNQQVRQLTQNQQKPPIKVKMKIGDIEFEIESQEDQIQTAVDRILTAVAARLKDVQLASPQPERQAPPPRAETCKGIIQKLWEENWFAEAKGLDDVHSELARRGFHYDRTAVAHALVDLVKDNMLTRIGRPRRYQYAQKRPPP